MSHRDTLTTHEGHLVSAHVGPVHLDRTDRGVELTLVAAVTPTATLTPEQARRLARALSSTAD